MAKNNLRWQQFVEGLVASRKIDPRVGERAIANPNGREADLVTSAVNNEMFASFMENYNGLDDIEKFFQ
jgi:hypothetical protein